VLPRARSLIYLEDQYLWSSTVVAALARALRRSPELRLIAVVPRFPDQDGQLSMPPNLVGRMAALELLYRAGGNRVAVYSLENQAGTPIYVHAKVCVVDDTWVMAGSDNFNRRSWTHDSELSCAVVGEAPGTSMARDLRLTLAREHLGIVPDGSVPDGSEGSCSQVFERFREAAARLDAWHRGGRHGNRPPGQLRSYPMPRLSAWTRSWAALPYRFIYDPDGRPWSWRRAGRF